MDSCKDGVSDGGGQAGGVREINEGRNTARGVDVWRMKMLA